MSQAPRSLEELEPESRRVGVDLGELLRRWANANQAVERTPQGGKIGIALGPAILQQLQMVLGSLPDGAGASAFEAEWYRRTQEQGRGSRGAGA